MDASTVLLLALLMMAGAALYTSVGHAAARRDDAPVRLTRDSAAMLLPRLVPIGVGGGLAAGFFGIGGGFLVSVVSRPPCGSAGGQDACRL